MNVNSKSGKSVKIRVISVIRVAIIPTSAKRGNPCLIPQIRVQFNLKIRVPSLKSVFHHATREKIRVPFYLPTFAPLNTGFTY